MTGMIKVAEWNEHSYYLVENSSKIHMIIAKDKNGKEATFSLQTGELLSADQGFFYLAEAKRFINEFKGDFINYWNDCKAS